MHPGAALDLPLDVSYEYATLVLNGDCSLEGQPLQERVLYYLGANRSAVRFTSRSGGRLLLVGGPPFPEKILMWWNFVARTPQEIADARTDWEERRRFGEVTGYSGPRLAAPSLVKFASPNPASWADGFASGVNGWARLPARRGDSLFGIACRHPQNQGHGDANTGCDRPRGRRRRR